jgi:hypothetical protein
MESIRLLEHQTSHIHNKDNYRNEYNQSSYKLDLNQTPFHEFGLKPLQLV